MESWVWKVREALQQDPAWHFTHLDGSQAGWISPDRLDEQRRILPPVVNDRLWNNIWSAGSGDALVPADVDAAVTLAGPLSAGVTGFNYYAGLDLSVSRDHSALALLGKDGTGRLSLAQVRSWVPPRGGKIDLELVVEAVWGLHQRFTPLTVLTDPYQAELLAQQLTRRGCEVETVQFTGKNLLEMASGLIEVFASRTIDLYDDAALLADLRRLRIAESPSGWKLAAPRTAAGHCDRATALALAVLGARRRPLVVAAGPQAFLPARPRCALPRRMWSG
jgi:phage terminase large subunit-like protein